MIEQEFVVPDRTEDLCQINESQYVVNDVSSVRDLSADVKTFKELLQEDGDNFIFKHFDTFYSMLRQFPETDETVRFEAYEILLEVSQNLINEVPAVLEATEEFSNPEVRFKYRNLIKMTVYLLCQLAEAYETEILKPSIIVSEVKKGRKKKKTNCNSGWDSVRNDFVAYLGELYKLPINRLWEPPIIEHEFVNIVTLSFFKLLENPEVILNQDLSDDISDFLGYSLKAHDTDLGYSIKIIQLVQDYQHLPSYLPKLIQYFVKQYGKKSIITEIFREVGCLESDDLVRDTERTHRLSNFLIGIAERCTNEVVHTIDTLLPNLEEESHIIRNCVITIVGEVVIKISTSEEFSKTTSNLRDELINTLLDHMLDMNAFVRCKVLQVARHLVDDGAMPLSTQLQFLERALERLKDKTCNVRKNALQFLKTFLVANPFAAKVPIDELKVSYEREKTKLQKMMPEIKKFPAMDLDSDEETSETESSDKKIPQKNDNPKQDDDQNGDKEVNAQNGDNAETHQNDGEDSNMDCDDDDSSAIKPPEPSGTTESDISGEEKAKQLILVEYLKLTLQSAEAVVSTMPWICEILRSTAVTDVLEAIEFVSIAFELGLREAVSGIKQMMKLIFSKEPAVKAAVVASYKKLYLTTKEDEDRDVAASLISKNLIMFLHDATENEVLAIEQFIREFIKTGDINGLVFEKLWKNFLMETEKTTEEESLSSLVLLSMAASEYPSIIMNKLPILARIGFGIRGKNNFQLAKETCKILRKIDITHQVKIKSKIIRKRARLAMNHMLFLNLTSLLVHGIIVDCDNYCPMAEQAIALIFKYADFPQNLCKIILYHIVKKMFTPEGAEDNEAFDMRMVFIRFLFLCGHVAMCYVAYLEEDLLTDLKQRERLRPQRKAAKTTTPLNHSGKKRPVTEKDNNNDGSEFQGAEAEDVISEFIMKICNEELLNEDNLLGMIFNAILYTCKLSIKNLDPKICAAATLALAKFMTINAKTCEQNMQLMMTLLEKSPDPCLRSNIVIAMGDLLIRFPNEVHPWTPNLYKRLKDENEIVRLDSLVILAHLILHDLVKVKGQISDIALCMINDTEEIATVVKYIFKELSKKKNTLYNLLPDLISGLSDTSTDVPEEHFQTIISYVFQFIGKEREVEGLVEKLCARLKDISTPDQLHKIMFSLGLFTMTEKCFRKVMEYKDCFKGKHEDEKFVSFMKEILSNARKNSSKLEQEITVFENELCIH